MNNANWVCFDCRVTQRRPSWRLLTFVRPWLVGDTWGGAFKCHICGKPCKFLGHKIAIPPKRDDNAWKQLHEYVTQRHRSYNDGKSESKTRRKHQIEQRIKELQSRPENIARRKLINELTLELDKITPN